MKRIICLILILIMVMTSVLGCVCASAEDAQVDVSVFDTQIEPFGTVPAEGLLLEDTKGFDKAVVMEEKGQAFYDGELIEYPKYVINYYNIIDGKERLMAEVPYHEVTYTVDGVVTSLGWYVEDCSVYRYKGDAEKYYQQEVYSRYADEFVLRLVDYRKSYEEGEDKFWSVSAITEYDATGAFEYKSINYRFIDFTTDPMTSVYYGLDYDENDNLIKCKDDTGAELENFNPITLPYWNELMAE